MIKIVTPPNLDQAVNEIVHHGDLRWGVLSGALKSAAFESKEAFATSGQGTKADTAVQPAALNSYPTKQEIDNLFTEWQEGLGTAAFEPKEAFASAAQGENADTALQTLPTLVTLGTPQVITASKTFRHPTNPNMDITISGREFSEHPVVPSEMAQTSFANSRADRYVTEAQLAAGGVGHQNVDVSSMFDENFTATGRIATALKKNGWCMLTIQVQRATNGTTPTDVSLGTLPPSCRPSLQINNAALITGFAGGAGISVQLQINNNGIVKIIDRVNAQHPIGAYYIFTITYPVN